MPRHIDEDIAPPITEQAFTSWCVFVDAVGEESDKVLDCDFVAAVVDFDVVAVEVEGAVDVVVDGAGEEVAGVAGNVVGEHEDDLRVGDAETFDGAVEGEDVGEVPVVEPEAGGAD